MKLDPRLRHYLSQRQETGPDLAEAVGLARDIRADTVEILVRYAGGEAALEALRNDGLNVRFTTHGAFSVTSGEASVNALKRLGEHSFVGRVEASRVMVADLDHSLNEVRAIMLHRANPPRRGAGAVVGIVDSGIDYSHPDFRNADGTSRIAFLWDQGAVGVSAGTVPYGREYTKADLDRALATPIPLAVAPHGDVTAHGTHVAGIAAGNGVGSAERLTGMAPEADLIVVAFQSDADRRLGRSVRAFDAFTYIVDRASGRPVAINMSQGMNGGGHSGETVLETGLDSLVRQPGVVVVKSAGNEHQWRIHAGGVIRQDETVVLGVEVENNNHTDSIIEVWYGGDDRIDVAVQPPGEAATHFVSPGDRREDVTTAGNRVSTDSELDADDTGDGMVTIILSRGSAGFIQPGTWCLLLRGAAIRAGRYDAWIERAQRDPREEQARFSASSADLTRTISVPGTAKRIITVSSYVTRRIPELGGALEGDISVFSSRGPTRYGLRKPELAAPGEWIVSARSAQSKEPEPVAGYTAMAGTSMAAPHVTGAAALMLASQPALTCEQVKQILVQTARRDGVAASAPDDIWGSGRLDVEAAIRLAAQVRFPAITAVMVSGATLRWATDVPTTSAVRYHTHQRQLQLGRNLGSQSVLMPGTRHEMTLVDVTPGTYYCEIVAFSADNWWTVDDKGGVFYVVEVGDPTEKASPPSSESQIVRTKDHVIIAGIKIPVRVPSLGSGS